VPFPSLSQRIVRLAIAAGLCAVALPGAAQQSGPAGGPQIASVRLTGVVSGPDEQPLAGALVHLWRKGSTAPELAATADEHGRWWVVGLEPGRWEIRIEARGYVAGEGWVQVPAEGSHPPVEVELRSLQEGTPAFSEGSPMTVQRWLERGNSLLAQGRTAEARQEYEKALGALPVEERPQVLQGVARTWFLEGDREAAVTSLEQALRIAPRDAELRQLYGALLAQLGRGEETESRLADLEAAGPPAEPSAADEPAAAPELPGPLLEPQADRPGRYRTRFAVRAPSSSRQIYLQRYGLSADQVLAVDPGAMESPDPAGESFEVVVPDGYRRGTPYGLLVWISPTSFGGFHKPEIGEVLAAHRVLWVGADRAGNPRWSWDRVALALDAAANMEQLYDVDPARVWVAGYSGGGRIASTMTLLFPEIFSGGAFFFGCDWYERLAVPDKPGSLWPEKFPVPAELDRVQRESRLVFVTGDRDFNRAQTKATWKRARSEGFAHLSYFEIPGGDHYTGVTAEWLDRVLAALSGESG
jgi:tetratricopeptide (TPR) repeat protein